MWIIAAAPLAAVLLRAAPAVAAPVEDRALTHLDRGVAAYRAGDYARARGELREASALVPDRPNPYRWLAMTEVQLGDCPSALFHIESFLSRVPAGDPRVPEVIALRTRCVEPSPPAAAVAAPAPAPAPEPSPPLIHRWWFWTAIGAVAITAAGVTYGLTRGGDPRLPPVTCGPTGCHP
jgi:hypothetical protein